MTNLRLDDLEPNKLLLDPNNYRFQDQENFVYAREDRYHEKSVQQKAIRRIRAEPGLIDLKRSILRNGFIGVERLVVRPYSEKDNLWVVIEGNRRLAAVRWILDDNDAGADMAEELIESIRKLPVAIAEEAGVDEVFRASLMGIRHVSGIGEWGGYQRAKLVAVMRDDLDLEPGEVAERLGLSTHEVNRRYRAFKALEQMQADEEFGEHAVPSMYPLFHEAVSLPIVRDWLGWDEDQVKFSDDESTSRFYQMLVPIENENGDPPEPKIRTYIQVRELRRILPNQDSRRLLLDDQRPFEDALAAAKREEFSRLWASDVTIALEALENMGVEELKGLDDDGLELLKTLKERVEERLSDYLSLTGTKSS